MTDKKSPVKLEITQDKLVDYLMHAATREDIAECQKVTNRNIEILRQDTKSDIAETNRNIETLRQDTQAEFKSVRVEMTSQFRWLVGLIFSGLITMTAVLLKFLH